MKTFADPEEFCERHKGNHLIRRCAHLGDRYVAELRIKPGTAVGQPLALASATWDSGYIDYSEDLPDDDMIVEGHRFETREEAATLWEEMTGRMLRGEAPNGDFG